ncbi:uncharacterized protein LOC143586365 [Bidens hawaiensis]|uniref:uncharacterized protein LOC143586365 n=1 Tax=Bidens hawaiensis TaxID=980011 RepID=UPI00404B1F8F
MESAQYSMWSELFKIHCKAYHVYNHISPHPPPTTSSSKETDPKTAPKPETKETEDWERIDSIVLQWIYGTISTDLLNTIMKKDTTVAAAWSALEDIFQDNKVIRAIHLNNKLSNTRIDNFPNASAYCQELKVLADQLANVDAPVDDTKLVMQLITGHNEQFESFATLLANSKPLPYFYEARSKLIYEADRKAQYASAAAATANTALHASTTKSPSLNTNSNEYRVDNSSDQREKYRNDYHGRGRS